ncbi:hypothetical protein P154DRAFT_377688, partial [Amniculicola lignicola CBS 123094]
TPLKTTSKPKPAKRKPLFDDDDETSKPKKSKNEEEILEFNFDETAAVVEPPKKSAPLKPKGPPLGPPPLKKKETTISGGSGNILDAQERLKEAIELDPTIFDYDAAYDVISARKAAKASAEEEDALQRRPKYMENLFESAEVRKKDLLRARDKLVQREREAEGDEFADKEKFVTGAYKQQQEETRKAEEEEKKRQEAEDEKRRKTGMQSFHRRMLLEEEKRHEETLKAAAELAKKGTKPDAEKEEEKTAEQLAKEMLATGKNITMNDDGLVTDKRQLLSVGLNVVAKPKKTTAAAGESSRPSGPPQPYKGRNPVQRETRERQTQMIAEQIEQAAKRAAEEEAEAQRKIEEAAKSRKTEADVMSAKERYLQRKKEAAAAK